MPTPHQQMDGAKKKSTATAPFSRFFLDVLHRPPVLHDGADPHQVRAADIAASARVGAAAGATAERGHGRCAHRGGRRQGISSQTKVDLVCDARLDGGA